MPQMQREQLRWRLLRRKKVSQPSASLLRTSAWNSFEGGRFFPNVFQFLPLNVSVAIGARILNNQSRVRHSSPPAPMGSLDWCECLWCQHWIWNGYIIDGMDGPLCLSCQVRLEDFGEPKRPNAICHRANSIKLTVPILQQFPDPLVRNIASYLESVDRAGRGSRRTPQPRPWWW